MKSRFFALAALLMIAANGLDAQTRQERLTKHVYYLASDELRGRQAGSEDGAKAAAYILNEYQQMGMKPFFEDWLQPFSGGNYANVVGVIEGSDPVLKDEYIVLGAHYDHLGVKNGEVYNGADDNASGSAALIEVARALMAQKDRLKRSVVIAAFDAEEIGLFGSRALADTIDISKVKLMMSIDMVGWLEKGQKLELEGVATIKDGKRILSSEGEKIGLPLKLTGFESSIFTATDTEYFAKKGVPTLAVSTGLKSPYHKPEDDADLIDYKGLDKISGYLSDLAVDFAADESLKASGKVAGKHRQTAKAFNVGVTGSIGSGTLLFKDAAFNGKSGFAANAGALARINFGKRGIVGLQAEGLYEWANALYPDPDNIYSAACKYTRSSIVVPVQLILQTDAVELGGFYVGIGGFYSHALQERGYEALGTPATSGYGLAVSYGLRLGGINIAITGRRQLSGMLTDGPKADLSTVYFTAGWMF